MENDRGQQGRKGCLARLLHRLAPHRPLRIALCVHLVLALIAVLLGLAAALTNIHEQPLRNCLGTVIGSIGVAVGLTLWMYIPYVIAYFVSRAVVRSSRPAWVFLTFPLLANVLSIPAFVLLCLLMFG